MYIKYLFIQVFKARECTDSGYMYDYCYDQFYKQHPLYMMETDALQLIAYYDDIETCNPIG